MCRIKSFDIQKYILLQNWFLLFKSDSLRISMKEILRMIRRNKRYWRVLWKDWNCFVKLVLISLVKCISKMKTMSKLLIICHIWFKVFVLDQELTFCLSIFSILLNKKFEHKNSQSIFDAFPTSVLWIVNLKSWMICKSCLILLNQEILRNNTTCNLKIQT